jgi:hypothetical protein
MEYRDEDGFHFDNLPNYPKNEETRKSFRELLLKEFDERLNESVERLFELPAIVVRSGDYLDLLLESRGLFVAGQFYSCVAMCGIVGERLVKDLLHTSIKIEVGNSTERPSKKAIRQLEKAQIAVLIDFLEEVSVLSAKAAKAAKSLGDLRNVYAHGSGKDPHGDARKAVGYLHEIIEDTVSLNELLPFL